MTENMNENTTHKEIVFLLTCPVCGGTVFREAEVGDEAGFFECIKCGVISEHEQLGTVTKARDEVLPRDASHKENPAKWIPISIDVPWVFNPGDAICSECGTPRPDHDDFVDVCPGCNATMSEDPIAEKNQIEEIVPVIYPDVYSNEYDDAISGPFFVPDEPRVTQVVLADEKAASGIKILYFEYVNPGCVYLNMSHAARGAAEDYFRSQREWEWPWNNSDGTPRMTWEEFFASVPNEICEKRGFRKLEGSDHIPTCAPFVERFNDNLLDDLPEEERRPRNEEPAPHWVPLKVYPIEATCSECGELRPDSDTFVDECPCCHARMSRVEGETAVKDHHVADQDTDEEMPF